MFSNRSMPGCTVIPVLPYPEIDQAIDWLCQAFGFTVRLRIGDHRAQLNIGDGAVILTQGQHAQHTALVMVRIEDVHRHSATAVGHGAHLISAPADHPYGERQYSVEDLAGHRWTFSQSISDVDPMMWGGTPVNL